MVYLTLEYPVLYLVLTVRRIFPLAFQTKKRRVGGETANPGLDTDSQLLLWTSTDGVT